MRRPRGAARPFSGPTGTQRLVDAPHVPFVCWTFLHRAPMASDIFISYRRDDSEYPAGDLYDFLCGQLGEERVFMDVDNIPLGVDFREHLKHVLKDCRVVIAVIGPKWGQRLRDPIDHVRDELEAALERGIPLIPVFVHGLESVPADLLPDTLQRLPYMNGTKLRGGFDQRTDRERLLGKLRLTLGTSAPVPARPTPPAPSTSQSADRARHALARGDVLAAISALRAVPAERLETGDGPDYDALVDTATVLVGKMNEEWNAGRIAAERYGMEIERGARLWEAGAWMGEASLQLLRAYSLDKGLGVEQNAAQAAVWYRKAAEQGHAAAQCNLGNSYYNGAGVSKDMTEAAVWYRKAAEQGHAAAQFFLGVCYHNGYGVPKDMTEAVVWYRKAAEQGHADAINALKELGQPWRHVPVSSRPVLGC
ncbi:MAG: toll/interleukin-1 receptor domain-containing protein [Bacteroidetes bacterium]|nr:toll/interleukin-1 receptor domain-containing protein [Bacteroidota bacterium]